MHITWTTLLSSDQALNAFDGQQVLESRKKLISSNNDLYHVYYFLFQVLEYKGESVADKEKIFKMFHTKKMYFFQAVSKEEADR